MGIAWTPDGQRVTYSSGGDIYWRSADGSATPQQLLAADRPQYASSWSADGRLLLFNDDHATNRFDIWLMPLNGEPRPLLATRAHELEAMLSPDGRWVAYQSDESGRTEVYVKPFPDVDSAKWTLSTGGGMVPAWSPTGGELFYMSGTTLMSVAVGIKESVFSAAEPEPLFSGPFETGSPQFDVAPDGRSFVMVEADPNARPTQLDVILNWHAELTRP